MTFPAIEKFIEVHKDEEILLITPENQTTILFEMAPTLLGAKLVKVHPEIYDRLLPPVKGQLSTRINSTGIEERYCVLNASSALEWCIRNMRPKRVGNQVILSPSHLSKGFAYSLGVSISKQKVDLVIPKETEKIGPEEPYIVFSVLSHSDCSRKLIDNKYVQSGNPANKMVRPEIWSEVLKHLGKRHRKIFVAGSNEELFDIEGAEWIIGKPLDQVARLLKESDLVVSIDNGIGHVAEYLDCNILSIIAAVPESLIGVNATKGRYYCVNHSTDGFGDKVGIWTITAEDILKGIFEVFPGA